MRAMGSLGHAGRLLGSELRLAASFLTVLPLGSIGADNAVVAGSFRWFPMVGFAIGGALGFEDIVARTFFSDPLAAIIVVLTMVVVTGAVHLDALVDTADALGAGRDRRRALDILRDSRIGTFGAAAAFFALAIETATLASIPDRRRFVALFISIGLARWAMVAVAGGLEYLRPEGGAGATLLQRDSGSLIVASATAAAAIAVAASGRVLAAASAAILVTLAARAFYRRWLGGVTGDLIGACGELALIAMLLVFAAG